MTECITYQFRCAQSRNANYDSRAPGHDLSANVAYGELSKGSNIDTTYDYIAENKEYI